jgi:hypothetical protein
MSSHAIVFLFEGNRDIVLNKNLILLNIEEDPKTFEKAMASRDVSFWKKAINDKMDSILSNNTWILVDLPLGFNLLGVNGCLEENTIHMGLFKILKPGGS